VNLMDQWKRDRIELGSRAGLALDLENNNRAREATVKGRAREALTRAEIHAAFGRRWDA